MPPNGKNHKDARVFYNNNLNKFIIISGKHRGYSVLLEDGTWRKVGGCGHHCVGIKNIVAQDNYSDAQTILKHAKAKQVKPGGPAITRRVSLNRIQSRITNGH